METSFAARDLLRPLLLTALKLWAIRTNDGRCKLRLPPASAHLLFAWLTASYAASLIARTVSFVSSKSTWFSRSSSSISRPSLQTWSCQILVLGALRSVTTPRITNNLFREAQFVGHTDTTADDMHSSRTLMNTSTVELLVEQRS